MCILGKFVLLFLLAMLFPHSMSNDPDVMGGCAILIVIGVGIIKLHCMRQCKGSVSAGWGPSPGSELSFTTSRVGSALDRTTPEA